MNVRYVFLVTASALALSAIPDTAAAQAGDEVQTAYAVNDILVTARKRQESLQEIPLTITAFDSEKLEAAGIANVEQLTQFTPGWHFENAGSRQGSSARIRGLDINTNNPTRQNASFFLDGVYFPGTVQSLDFNDIAQVEVIKGPQSAFFGRQTFGGAINFTTKEPTNELEARLSATAATDDYYDLSGSISVPLIEEKLFFRGSARYYSYGGPFRDTLTGERLGAQESRNLNTSLIARPTDNLELKLRYINIKDDDGPIASAQIGSSQLNCGPFGTGSRKFYCGELPVIRDFQINTNVAPNNWGVKNFGFSRDADMFSAQARWDFGGGYSLTGSFAQYQDSNVDVIDADLTAVPAYGIATFQEFNDKSYELRLASPEGRLRWLVGAYYYDGFFSSNAIYSYGPDFSVTPARQTPDIARVENLAFYGSATYQILDNLSLSGELRWQSDEVTNEGGQNAARRVLSGKTKAVLPRVILDWKPTRDIMAYAVFSQGNKPQQFNANIAGLSQAQRDFISSEYGVGVTLDEERLDNYEFGLKTKWLDGRLTANMAMYQMDWKDQVSRVQVFRSASDAANQLGQLDVAANSGSSRIRGFELETSFAATPRLHLEGSFALTDAKYTDFNSVYIEQVTGNPDAVGNRAPRFPKYQASFGASHTTPVDDDWNVVARADLSYMGKRYTDESNLAWMGDYALVNARLSAESERLRISLFVDNLFNQKGFSSAQRYRDMTAGGIPFAFAYTLLIPRRIGITTSLNF
ncbi:TonB-dependent receptor [Sphingomonas sp. C3-2]|uniref:TonB-dependent receptor n=1 Tax=Sphingomonas sp. C3-2 TaxID=3062169 RepID=UPI00294AA6FE|nr:TonB-dependent receptor [Sphingomonas sp. C3-2]WOK35471.1 TonB-dependent receptor [Sphingomonas sp. C3-2]